MLSLGWSRWLRLPVAVAILVPEPAPGLLGAISLATADAQSWPFITITAFPTMDINEGPAAISTPVFAFAVMLIFGCLKLLHSRVCRLVQIYERKK